MPRIGTLGGMSSRGFGEFAKTGNPIDPIAANFIVWLEGSKYNGTTWTATKGSNPTKTGTITAGNINGYSAAYFGSNSYFSYSSITIPSSLSVFAVAYEEAGFPLIVEQSTNANSLNGFYFYSDQGFPYAVYRSSIGTRLSFNSASEWFPANQLQLGCINFDGTNFTLGLNSTNISTTSAGPLASYATSTNATDIMYIGSRAGSNIFFQGGYLAELIISPALSSTNFTIVRNYLRTKYGLA